MSKRNTFAVLSFLRNTKDQQNPYSVVYIRLSIDGKRTEFSSKILVEKTRWDSSRGRIRGNSAESKSCNEMIANFEHRLREIYNRYIEQGKTITIESIKNEILGIGHNARTLLKEFQQTLTAMEARNGCGFAWGTIKNWKVTLGHLREFLDRRYNIKDITFRELSLSFIVDFELYAKTNWGCRTNAALKHIERIRKVVKRAVIHNWIHKDPFLGFECKMEKSHRTYLTLAELRSIESKQIEIERLGRVRDVFIFCCYTGLAHVDVEKLTVDNIVEGIDGKKWIYTFREKTKTKCNIPLLPAALSILEKYVVSSHPMTQRKILPVITNIKTNAYLKEIAAICGISKNLTFHMARHTFATTVTLTNGVPIESVSSMLGHTKITTTQIYAKVIESKVSEDMKRLDKIFV